LIMGTALFLLSIGGGVGALLGWSPESQAFTQGGLARIADLTWWRSVGGPALDQLRLSPLATLVIAIGGTAAVIRLRDHIQRVVWFGLLFFIVCITAITMAYIAYMEGVYRYVTPISPFIALAVSVAIGCIVQAIFQRRDPTKRETHYLPTLVCLIIGVIWIAPILPNTLSIVQERTRPDTRAALADWSLPILTEPYETILQDSRDERTFVRDRAGYRGLWQWQRWEDPFQQSVEAWRAEGVNWLMATQKSYTHITETDEGRAWASDILFLKSFPPEGEIWRGPALRFYRLTPPMNTTDVTWAQSVHLMGYDLTKNGSAWTNETLSMQPGAALAFTGYWQALQTPATDLHLFMHVRPADDLTQVVAQLDGLPVEMRPTTTWNDPHETLIGTTYSLTWPDLPEGDYVLIIGVYDLATGARLLTDDGADGWSVLPIHSAP
jgi:hypothetical protein